MQKNIVILGAGFGGIKAALDLDRALGKIATSLRKNVGAPRNDNDGWRVTLIDRNAQHIYYPKLFEEVIPRTDGVQDEMKCAVPLSAILKGTGVEFIQADIKGIDSKGRMVEVTPSNSPLHKGEKLSYEYLILALGADADYFGISGLKEYATVLRGMQDAMKIRERVEEFLKIHN